MPSSGTALAHPDQSLEDIRTGGLTDLKDGPQGYLMALSVVESAATGPIPACSIHRGQTGDLSRSRHVIRGRYVPYRSAEKWFRDNRRPDLRVRAVGWRTQAPPSSITRWTAGA